jgi:hypothetical protein
MSIAISSALANAEASAAAELFNDAQLLVFDGKRPANADTPIDGQKLLLRFQFSDPAFQKPRDGLLIAHHIIPELNAPANGTATWYRVLGKHGVPVVDGSVGEEGSGANLILPDPEIRAGQEMHLASYSHDIKGREE